MGHFYGYVLERRPSFSHRGQLLNEKVQDLFFHTIIEVLKNFGPFPESITCFHPWQAQTGCLQRRITVMTNTPHPFSLFLQKIRYYVGAMDSEIQRLGHNFGKPGLKYSTLLFLKHQAGITHIACNVYEQKLRLQICFTFEVPDRR